ncbi:MAG: lipid A deacylase LpxR family protein, partial [Candidatus Aminicenantes bacterium]|nr:lipid A deacylase LpxR family protein [Candidatus Aminicenantes bacterium]
GISYIGIGFNSQSNCRMSSLEFRLGIVGPHSYAEKYQKILHELINVDYPRGWDNQLKDELVLGINYDQKWRLLRSEKERDFGYDLITHMGGGLGNLYTGATAGIEVRIGKDLPNDFGSFPIHPGGDSNAIFSKEDSRLYCHSRPRIHAFAAVNVNAVVRDVFLDGNTFQDSHRVEKNSFTGDIVVGVALAVNRFKISYAYVYRTKRFKTQRKPQVFGSINISFSY